MSAATQTDTEVLVRLRNEASSDGWIFTADLNDVPEETGNYGLSDGLRGCGGGSSHNMRASIVSLMSHRKMVRPIYSWLPDHDGSAALWLEGQIRCSRCPDKPILSLDDIDEHGVEVHGDDPECEC